MTKDILVPVDGSPLSLKALRHALTEFPDASVSVLHVIDPFEPGYGEGSDLEISYEPLMGTEEWQARADEISKQVLAEARELAEDYDREVTTTSEIGDPKQTIVGFAEENDIDHIVLGAHGRTEEERPVFGSNAEMVARRATVPVTLIR